MLLVYISLFAVGRGLNFAKYAVEPFPQVKLKSGFSKKNAECNITSERGNYFVLLHLHLARLPMRTREVDTSMT